MKKYTHEKNGLTFKKITKEKAEAVYMNGVTIICCPCNLNPFTLSSNTMELNRRKLEYFAIDEKGVKNNFNNYIDAFEYYHCISNETGRYTAFYIPVRTED